MLERSREFSNTENLGIGESLLSDQYNSMWEYLQDAPMNKHTFGGAYHTYWGRYVERLARRIIRDWMSEEKMQELFPDVEVISSERIHPYGMGKSYGKIFRGEGAFKGQVDSLYLLHVKKGEQDFAKYAVGFEVKYGASSIDKSICDFWRDFLSHPDGYINKCEKARLFIFWVHGIDPPCVFYTLKEIIPKEFPPDRTDVTER